MTDAPTVVRYEPRGAARQLFACRDGEVLLDGPAGTGKSLAALYRLHLAALQHPGIRCLVARKTAVSLGSTTLVTFEEQVAKAALAERVVRWFGGSPKEAAAYRYTNGSKIVVGGLDKPEKVLSSEYDLIFVDEATELTVTDWETLSTRLRHGRLPWQQQIAACNPAHPQHWMNERADAGLMTRLISRHVDNPAYVNADGSFTARGVGYMAKLQALTGVRRLRLYDGKWAAAEGIIYDGWDPVVHLIDHFAPPLQWERWWGVDFGYTNPQVTQCFAEDPDGRLFLYREWYHTRKTVDQHAADILAVVAPGGRWVEPRPRAVVCDHDAEGRAVLERELGLSTTPAHKAVTEGIQAVQARLRPAGDGRPRLFVMRDVLVSRDADLVEGKRPACTAEEIPGYVWAVKPGAAGGLKEEPVKADDHGLDALRYVVAERDFGRQPRYRSFRF